MYELNVFYKVDENTKMQAKVDYHTHIKKQVLYTVDEDTKMQAKVDYQYKYPEVKTKALKCKRTHIEKQAEETQEATY